MSFEFLRDLTRQTLMDPRGAAGRIIALDLSREWLWMALVLMSVLNTIVYTLLMTSVTHTDPAMAEIAPILAASPTVFAVFLTGVLVMLILTLTWVGKSLGGQGQLRDVLALITWMQVLRLMVQLVLFVTSALLPVLGVIVVFAAAIWGLVILLCFIDRAHGFANLFKSALVLILSVIAMVLVLSLILGVLLGAATGGS